MSRLSELAARLEQLELVTQHAIDQDAFNEAAAALREAEQLLLECEKVLPEYTSVVVSVNRPDSFKAEVADAGGPARGLLAKVSALIG